MSWSTSELRVRLAPLNRFKPSSKIFYWPFQGGTSFVDLLCFCSVLCLLCFVRVCLYVLRGHLLGKGWPLGSPLWCLLWVCHFPIGILGQVWYLIVSIPDLCNLTYFIAWLNLPIPREWAKSSDYCPKTPPNWLRFSYDVQECLRNLVQITHDFSNQGICGQSFEQFKTFEPNSRKTYELQELTTDCANQLRSSRTEYDSDTNPNICQFEAIRGILGLCGIGLLHCCFSRYFELNQI